MVRDTFHEVRLVECPIRATGKVSTPSTPKSLSSPLNGFVTSRSSFDLTLGSVRPKSRVVESGKSKDGTKIDTLEPVY